MNAYPGCDIQTVFGTCVSATVVPADYERVMTLDTLIEGVHFPVLTSARDIAYKSVAVNFSDLAAMGAEPRWLYLSLTIPEWDRQWLESFWLGMQEPLLHYQAKLAAVNINQGKLAVSIEAHGIVPEGQALLRSGARISDAVYVTGTLGDAGYGLRQPDVDASLLQRLNRPTARVEAGICLRGFAHAVIDVSDGLLADLGHLADAGSVAIQIDLDRVPISQKLRQCAGVEQAQQYALSAGDDYELCFTMPVEHEARLTRCLLAFSLDFTRIGKVTAGNGVQLLDSNGRQLAYTARGYDHFA